MAAREAAREAAAIQAAARESTVRQAANKQLDSLQHAVQSLKEVSYDKWKQQLERQTFAYMIGQAAS